MYSRREEQFLDDLEAIVDSGGGMIRIGNMRRDIDDLEAEAALLYLEIAGDIVDIGKAMSDFDYFREIVANGKREMGLDEKTLKTYKEFITEKS